MSSSSPRRLSASWRAIVKLPITHQIKAYHTFIIFAHIRSRCDNQHTAPADHQQPCRAQRRQSCDYPKKTCQYGILLFPSWRRRRSHAPAAGWLGRYQRRVTSATADDELIRPTATSTARFVVARILFLIGTHIASDQPANPPHYITPRTNNNEQLAALAALAADSLNCAVR